MKSIVEKIEDNIGDIVFYAARHAEYYERYVNEVEKTEFQKVTTLDDERIAMLFSNAKRFAIYSVEAAEGSGLDPERVTKTCWDFLIVFNIRNQQRKGAA